MRLTLGRCTVVIFDVDAIVVDVVIYVVSFIGVVIANNAAAILKII
jgi:hypothetical protein